MGRIRHSQGLLRAFLLLASFIILALAMAPMPVAAIMGTDFGFESGLTGWSTYGNVSTGSGGDYLAGSNTWTVGPYETKMAVVGPSGNSGVFTTVADALGLSASSQSYLTTTFPNITNMAYIYADIPLAAGESFTMAWNYVATDYAPYNDASFCSLVNLNDAGDVPLVNGFNAEVSILGATVTGTGNYSTGDYGSTGWQTAAFQASGAGTYRLGFTVFNLTDTQYNPYLFVDKDPGTTLKNGVPFNPVPPDDDPPPPPVTVAPSVTTGTASAITAVSAFVSGHVTSDGGEPVAERGIVFGLAPNPTTVGSKAAGGSGTGLFSAQLTGLAPGATYYARAYAINVKGTSYGDTISFTTVPPAPTVAAATAVTASSFTANWTAVAGATGYRLDVATDSSFLHVVSGYANLDAGSATSRTVSGLAAATPYYIRVRATNSAGTSPNSNTVTATTAKADQSISFPPLASRTYGDADFNPGATATSGLTVTYTSSNPQVATIVDNQVHIVGQGTATITAAQAGNGSWNPAPDQAQTLTVLRKTVTLAGTLAASNKTYDGTTAAIVTADGLSLVGLVGDDQVTVNPVGTFSDKNAAPGKTVSLTAATSLSGTDSENYTLSLAGAPAGQAAILQRLLTLSAFHADDKIYDGTVAAFGTGFEDDRISGDDLTFSYAAAFSDADIGVAKPVTFSDIAISGGLDAMNYTLADASGSTQATIERKNLHITLVDKSKTYGQIDPLFEATYSGFVSGEGPETLGSVVLYRVGGENAGTYTISYMIWDELAHNYTLIEHEGTFTIDTRPLTLVNRQAEDKVYDGTRAASASATLSGVLPGDNVGLQLSDILFDTKHAGTGKSVSATQILTGAQADNYSLTPAVPFATAAIGSRPLELSQFSADDKVYDGTTDATYTYQADQLPGDDLVFDLTAAFSDSQAGEDKLVTLTVDSLGGMDAANYTLMTPELTDTASISPVTLTVTGALALDKTYDGTRAAEVSGAVLHGVLAGDSVILDQATSGLFEQKAVGSNLNVTTNMTLTGEDSGNYVLAQPVLNKATIFQRVVFVVGAVAQDKAYDGTSIATITGAQPIGLIPGDDVALINRDIGLFPQLSPGSGLPVLPLMSLSGSDAPNYALMPPMLNNASILPRTLEVRAEDKEKTYGQIDPPLTVSYTGFAPGEDVSDLSGSLIVWRQTGENAGSYEIRLGSTLSSLNYAIEIQYGSLTIQPRTLTVSGAAASDKVYDGTPAASVSGAILQGVLEQDIGQVSLVQDTTGQFNQTNAGNGIAVVTSMALTGTKSGNYSLEQPGLFADILPCPITVTADARNKTYGDADPELTWQVTAGSLIGTDAPTGTPSRETGEDVGEYAISQGSLDFGDNYTVTFVSNNLTITARPITVKADVKSKTYGDADPELTWQVTAGSLVGTDAPTGTLNRAVGEDVGDYAIEPGSLDFGDNYTVTYVSDNLTITARAITVTADVKTKVYGDADPELTWQVTDGSLVGTDAPLGSLSREAGEDVGVYTIEQGSLAFGGNYCVSFVGSDLAIASRSLTIQAVSCSKTYGDADPAWQVMYENLASWDSEAVVQGLGLARAPGEAVGSYVISPSGATADNYTVIMLSGTLTIDKRPLTITAAAQTKGYGTADPAFSYALTAGSLIGDDSLTGELSRESGENVGSYDILQNSLTAGGNYQITFVGAELTITPYAEPLLHGSVANGHDPDNSGQISFVAESDDGYAFAYWSDGHTVFSTNPILTNPVGGIAGYHPVIWPIGPSTDLQAIGMSAQNESAVLFLNGVVRMVLPAHVDPEAVIAVTACDAVAGQDLLPSGMAAAQPFFCFLRSENLVGERIRIEIDLAQAGIQLGDEERESLTLYRWNEEEQIWKTAEIARQGVDWETGILWAEVEQFSTYGLFYTPQLVQTGETPVNGAWLLLLVGGCLMALILARKRLPGLGGRSDADA